MRRQRRAPNDYGFDKQSNVGLITGIYDNNYAKHPRYDNPITASLQQGVANYPSVEKTTFELPVMSPPDPRIRTMDYSPTPYSYEDYERG